MLPSPMGPKTCRERVRTHGFGSSKSRADRLTNVQESPPTLLSVWGLGLIVTSETAGIGGG